jgi:histidyl-tRNA synthetase
MSKPEPRVFRGFRDSFAADQLGLRAMIDTVQRVYERYGFVPLETPAVEFVDVLGKYLPESDQPAGGIFSFRNPDITNVVPENESDLWLAMRYDLTASLARVVAQYVELQKPFRRYQVGKVWRHEKPGPGRFREFLQFDFDTVGTESMAADAECCVVICDAMSELGFEPGDYIVRVNSRNILKGVLETCGIDQTSFDEVGSPAGTALRAIDKLDQLGLDGVVQLLGEGRKDETGDYTKGAGLDSAQIDRIVKYLETSGGDRGGVVGQLESLVGATESGALGIRELGEIDGFLTAVGCGDNQVSFDPTIVRGLGYYTGPVFECMLLKEFRVKNRPLKLGSVFSGGRYDGLVERFTGEKVPATGASIGVDRLYEAVRLQREGEDRASTADVLVTTMDPGRMQEYFELANRLRNAGISTELYLGSGGFRKQLKYADKLNIPFALIIGEDEFARGVCQVKDLWLGRRLAKEVESRDEWKEQPQQFEVALDQLVAELGSRIQKLS